MVQKTIYNNSYLIQMVKVKGFDGFTFKPELYGEILNKNMEYLTECDLFHSFNTQQFVTKGLLNPENDQFVYLYEQEFLGMISLGLLAELSLTEYAQKKIKQHEKTLIRPHLNENTYAKDHVGPVIVGHEHQQELDDILSVLKNTCAPFAQWQTVDGRAHKLWRVTEIDLIQKHYQTIASLYILDGHHRFEAASKNLQKLGPDAKEKDKWIQGVIYSTKYIRTYPQFRQLVHQDYRSVIRNIMGNQKLIIYEVDKYDPNSEIVLLQDEKFFQIKCVQELGQGSTKTGVQRLDQILHQAMSELENKCHSPIKFVPSIMFNFENLSSHSHPVFLVKCPEISTIFEIANQNQFLPPKSTWLEPKPCLHMVIRVPY